MKNTKLIISLSLLFISLASFAQDESIYQRTLSDYMKYRNEQGMQSQVFMGKSRSSWDYFIHDREIPVDTKNYPEIVLLGMKNKKDVFKVNNDKIVQTKFKIAEIVGDNVIITVALYNVTRKRNLYKSSQKEAYIIQYRFNCDQQGLELVKIDHAL